MTFHGAAFLGAIAAFNKYGDRTEQADKSLRSTKEALDTLLAYLGSTLADRLKPTIGRILDNSTQATGTIKEIKAETVADEFKGEAFRNDVSSFVISDIDELLSYRSLVHARDKWKKWAKRISRGVLVLVILEGAQTVGFFCCRVMNWTVRPYVLISTIVLTAAIGAFCIVCAAAKLGCDEKIAEYRDKVL